MTKASSKCACFAMPIFRLSFHHASCVGAIWIVVSGRVAIGGGMAVVSAIVVVVAGCIAVLLATPCIGAVGVVEAGRVAALLAVPDDPPRGVVEGRSVSHCDGLLFQTPSRVIVVGCVADSLGPAVVSSLWRVVMTALARPHLLVRELCKTIGANDRHQENDKITHGNSPRLNLGDFKISCRANNRMSFPTDSGECFFVFPALASFWYPPAPS